MDNFNTLRKFSSNVNTFFDEVINIKFYCLNETSTEAESIDTVDKKDKYDESEIVMIKNGEVLKRKRVKYLSEGYLNYLLDKFNLRQHIEAKVDEAKKNSATIVNNVQNFLQTQKTEFKEPEIELPKKEENPKYQMQLVEMKLDPLTVRSLNSQNQFILAEQTGNRFVRFIWAFLIVLVSSIACFLCVKGSIDWATSSQTELNKMRDAQLRSISEDINTKYSYVRTES